MFLRHVWGLFAHPNAEWVAIRDAHASIRQVLLWVMVLAVIPVASGFIGTTQFGWQIGTSERIRLTGESGAMIAFFYYLVLLAAVFSVGWMIHWMGATYGAHQPLSRCIALAAFIPLPLFLIGVFQLVPILWLNLIVGLPALAYTIFLLYTGIPVMMEIPAERGFLFASAVLAVGLVGLVGVLAVTVLLWGVGVGPVFTA
jgi:hypothetical protein